MGFQQKSVQPHSSQSEWAVFTLEGYVEALFQGKRLTLAEHKRNIHLKKINDDDDGLTAIGRT